jgi:hypothetical protein
MKRATAIAIGVLVLAGAIPAAAAEVTRDSYREEVEPICQVNTEANERILKGVRAEVKADELKPASRQFAKAARALQGTVGELKAVPRPPADVARLSKWLAAVEEEASYFKRVADQLKAGKKSQAQRMVVRLTSNAQRADNMVLMFEFHFCRLEPSRFT